MRIAGIVLDVYDDPKGLVLRNKIASSWKALPEKIGSTRVLSAEELEALPDRLFGLVATNDGEVLRKYAMHDVGHLLTSMVYFLEAGHLLPVDTQQKVAMNLINGCAWYEMDPPEALVKRAVLGKALLATTAGLGALGLVHQARAGAAQGRANMDAFRQAQASGMKTASGRQVELSHDEDRALQEGRGPAGGHIWGPLGEFSQHDATHKKLDSQLAKRDQLEPVYGGYPGKSVASPVTTKKADLVGTEIMPQATLSGGAPRRTKSLGLPQKTSAAKFAEAMIPEGWWHCGDLTHVEAPVSVKTARHEHYALPHRQLYPIDTPDLLKTASAYFDEHVFSIPLPERRIYAQSVVERAAELGVKVAGTVLDYAGTGYGPFIEMELTARITRFEGTGHEAVYELLQEKRAEIQPAVMAEMLRDADEATGAAQAYGRVGVGFLDPYAAVYGGPKLAAATPDPSDTYSWSEGNDYVSGFQLMALSKRGLNLSETFGKEFADSFQKDPIGVFKSIPSPQKVVISRLAADNSGSTFRI